MNNKKNYQFLERYKFKIKTQKEFQKILSKKKFIQCHGVFDVISQHNL